MADDSDFGRWQAALSLSPSLLFGQAGGGSGWVNIQREHPEPHTVPLCGHGRRLQSCARPDG